MYLLDLFTQGYCTSYITKMGEIPNVNPNFETMSRPRCGTWPMNRPNIEPRRNRMQGMGATLLDVTLEEANSQELLADESLSLMNQMSPRDELLTLLNASDNGLTTQPEFDGMLIGLPTADPVTDFSAISGSFVKSEPCRDSDAAANYCSSTNITELSNIGQDHVYDDVANSGQPMSGSIQSQNTSSLTVSPTSGSSLSKTDSCTATVTPSQPGTSGSTPKAPKSTRKNAWGNMSYADLITQAIESSPEKRLTLAQVYEWMVKNVPYFKDKGDSNSSAGWKNSIRHNLSLHAKFKRIQNEGTGKSSWWVINHDAKPGKSPRRRAISMDNASAKCNRSKIKAAKQKAELTKKQRAGLKTGQSLQRDVGSWSRDGIETTVSKALGSDYRPRASSNASSLGGRMSPSRMFLASDLEDDGAPPLSPPQSGSMNLLANVTMPSAFNSLFDMVRPDSSSIPENGPADRMLHESMLGSLAISSPAPYSPDGTLETKDIDGMYMQSSSDMKSLGGSVAQNSPNLANLLQQKTNPLTKTMSNNAASNMAPKTEPQAYDADSRKAFPYPDYQTRMMMPGSQYKSQLQQPTNEGKALYHYAGPQQNMPSGQSYRTSGAMQVPSQSQQPYNYNLTPQQSAMISTYLGDSPPQRPQMSSMGGRQQETQFRPTAGSLQLMPDTQFPPDLNGLTNHELLDAGDIDMNEIIRDMPQDYAFNMEFDKANGFFQQNVCTQVQPQTGDFGVCTNGSNSLPDNSMHSQQPMLHPNPDVFITSLQPGNTGDGCRMNSSSFQHMQTGQTSAIGGAPSYGMQ